jgi:hypothetical protein
MIRFLLLAGFIGCAVSLAGAQPKPQPPLLSELPMPKAGEKLKLDRASFETKKDDDGLLEVRDLEAGKTLNVTMPAVQWTLDADGWFDSEGFNVTKVYPRSGLWALRTVKGNRPAGSTGGSGLPSSPSALVPQAPPRLYRAGPTDIITHIDGIAVNTPARFHFALNSAANPRDIPIVVMSGSTGRKHVFYVTAYKLAGE